MFAFAFVTKRTTEKLNTTDNLDQMFEHTLKSPAQFFYDAFTSAFFYHFKYLQASYKP